MSVDLVIGHPHSLFVGFTRGGANNTNVVVALLYILGLGRRLWVGIPILRILLISCFVYLIPYEGTRDSTDTGTNEGTFTLMTRLVAHYGTQSGTECAT